MAHSLELNVGYRANSDSHNREKEHCYLTATVCDNREQYVAVICNNNV